MKHFIVFSDLDGSLLDSDTYSFEAARDALAALRHRNIPLILTSSKTRAEMEAIRTRLALNHPFIVENGGGLVIPDGYFSFPLEGARPQDGYQIVSLGAPYAELRAALKGAQQLLGFQVKGFGDMSGDEIAARTGLSQEDARLAQQREYDEPFVIDDPNLALEAVEREIVARGFHTTRGGRFHHLIGASDKGQACRILMEWYRRHDTNRNGDLVTIGIGDSANDQPMLAVVDIPILVQQPNASYDPEIRVPNLIHAGAIGPAGWNCAILNILETNKG